MPDLYNTEVINESTSPIKKYQFIYHFLPHPVHKRRASLLSNVALEFYCFLILLLIMGMHFVPRIAPGVLGYASDITSNDLLKLTNNKRAETGLSPLKINSTLSTAARKKAEHMFQNNYWAHVSPDGKEPWDFILGEGYDYIYAGENLAKNFANSEEVVNAWYNSPSHKDNLLNDHYTEIGFAVVNGVLDGYETTLVVQMFGSPRGANQQAAVFEEEQILQEVNSPANEADTVVTEEAAPGAVIPQNQPAEVLPTIDIAFVSKGLSVLFGTFVIILLGMDVWYTRRFGIVKINGQSIAHITFLLIVLVSIWFLLQPGSIL